VSSQEAAGKIAAPALFRRRSAELPQARPLLAHTLRPHDARRQQGRRIDGFRHFNYNQVLGLYAVCGHAALPELLFLWLVSRRLLLRRKRDR
jgi:hypothetical protein